MPIRLIWQASYMLKRIAKRLKTKVLSQDMYDWDLLSWFEAAGYQIEGLVPQILKAIEEYEESYPSYNAIRGWLLGPKATKGLTQGAKDIDHACLMIAVLRRLAQKNQIPLFDDNHIREQAHIFVNSKACKHNFRDPNENELSKICDGMPRLPEHSDLIFLRRKVQPPPPVTREFLFGRNNDINQVLKALDQTPIAIINAVGGEGKTSLAWFVAADAISQQRWQKLEWLTDKRTILKASGEVEVFNREPLDEIKILRSLIQRFEWLDLTAVDNDVNLLKKECAKRLRDGRYLIVFDNLETVEHTEEMIEFFLTLLSSPSHLPQSRVLITSREKVDNNQCKHVNLRGIDEDARVPYLRFLEGVDPLLTDTQCERLAHVTAGNPMFMQIALKYYELEPSETVFQQILSNLEPVGLESQNTALFYNSFQNLFGSMLSKLDDLAIELAIYAAKISLNKTVTGRDLQAIWQTYWQQVHGTNLSSGLEEYRTVLRSLVNNRVLNPVVGTDQYDMHALVKAFLLRNT
jgi:hypothetical protein